MVDPELEALRREFLAEADDKVHEMETSAAEPSTDAHARLAYLAHQLKGSGGSYGFPVISDEAAAVESAVDGGDSGSIVRHVAKLRAEIDRIAGSF